METQAIQDGLGRLESRRNELQARKTRSDRAALDYVKSLPGFREAYPEFAEEQSRAAEEEEQVISSVADIKAEWAGRIGEFVLAGDVVPHNGVRYIVLQPHTLQEDWVPGSVPALYRAVGQEGAEPDQWPEFVQPTGAHDAYAAGDPVTFDGKHYRSRIDNNVWSPADYPQGWEEVQE